MKVENTIKDKISIDSIGILLRLITSKYPEVDSNNYIKLAQLINLEFKTKYSYKDIEEYELLFYEKNESLKDPEIVQHIKNIEINY